MKVLCNCHHDNDKLSTGFQDQKEPIDLLCMNWVIEIFTKRIIITIHVTEVLLVRGWTIISFWQA